MKKKLTEDISPDKEKVCKIWMTMRLIVFLFFVSLVHVSASVYSQKTKLNIRLENATLQQVFSSIQEQSEFDFFYKNEQIPANTRISVEYQNEAIEVVLDKILKGTGLTYHVLDKDIVISVGVIQSNEVNFQQQKAISGKVTDSSGASLPGVSVAIKGKTIGTITDASGNYTISHVSGNVTLQFSFVGMKSQEITVTSQTTINVVLKEETIGVDEVVVTALGITREKKGLGYAIQEVKGDDLNQARETNFVNSLAGKVAGVNIMSSGAVGSSSRITIRGESSLSLQSNQPLYVIDGVPVGNDPVSNSTLADYGNSSAEVNPADVESLTVLKGPAASALYGSRAANGVILIVTKSGKGKKGIGVSVNSGTTIENILRLPKFQNEFGQGKNGQYEGSNFGASWSIYPDGVYDSYDESWGPRLNIGTYEKQFFSPTTGGMRGGDVSNPNRGDVIASPWIAYPNNIKDFFDTGHTNFNNVAISGVNDKGNFRLSYTNLDEKGVIPNNNLKRNTISFKTTYNFTNKFRTEISANYVNTTGTNRPENGYGRQSIMYFMTWFPRSGDMNALRNYWQTGFEGKKQFQYNYGENHNNPFFYQYENTKGQDKNRLYGNVSLNYDITSKLSLMGRVGTDFYNDFHPMKYAVSTVGREKGSFIEESVFYEERNYDFLLSYKDKVGSDFNYKVSLGGNQMKKDYRHRSVEAPQLLIPTIYSIANSASTVQVGSYSSKKRINSLYAFSQLDYKSKFYMDITLRNDWSSTLRSGNNSYFYPAISFSTLLDKIVVLPEWITQAKLRLGVAQVGNDTDPYQIKNSYSYVTPSWGSYYSLESSDELKNKNLKPERVTTYEIGTDIRLFNNRIGLDFTCYDIRSKSQLIKLPLPSSTSYSSRIINAGEVQNKGIEIMLNVVPIQLDNSLRWETTINFSKNIGKILDLADGVTSIVQSSPGENASLQARVGEKMGALYGPGFTRVESGNMKGEIIIGSNGQPIITPNDIYLGNVNPDWIGSLANEFSYKGFNLNILVDIHYGGKFISRFFNKAMGSGQLKESLLGRAARIVGTEYDNLYYRNGAAQVNGVYVQNGTSTDGTYSKGVYGTSARYFIKNWYDSNSEAQLFDATYMKLRELKFGYTVPGKVFRNVVKDVTLSIVGRNLFLWTPKSNQHFDPEVSVATSSDGLVPGFENMSLPSTKSYGFNLSFKF